MGFYLLGYAVKAIITEDIYDESRNEFKIFDRDEEVMLYQIPFSNLIMVQGIRAKELKVGEMVAHTVSSVAIDFEEPIVLDHTSEVMLEDNVIIIEKALKRHEIAEFVNDDELMTQITIQYNKLAQRFGR